MPPPHGNHNNHGDLIRDAGEAEMGGLPPEQIETLVAPNLEHATLCVETARYIATELGPREHLESLGIAIEHALHFLQLARGHVAHLQWLEQSQQRPAAFTLGTDRATPPADPPPRR